MCIYMLSILYIHIYTYIYTRTYTIVYKSICVYIDTY